MSTIREQANKAFANHTLVDRDLYGVYIEAPNSSFYVAEIRLLRWRRVIIHGDIAPVLIDCPHRDLEVALSWVGESNVNYIATKVSSGERQVNSPYELNRDVLIEDLSKLTNEHDWDEKDIEAIDTATMHARHGDLLMAQQTIAGDLTDGWEYAESLGRIISPRVHYAQAAATRAAVLLKEASS